MLAFIHSLFLFSADSGGESAATHFYNQYFNIPGFEAWKFLNLVIFFGILTYLLKKPLSESFKQKREKIRAELIRAEEEKQAALTKLAAAEAQLGQLETEKANVMQKATDEVEYEKKRLAEQTKADTDRLRQQADAEVARIANQSRVELRRFSADESIRLAEEKLRAQIDGTIDARLVKAGIQEIGGLN